MVIEQPYLIFETQNAIKGLFLRKSSTLHFICCYQTIRVSLLLFYEDQQMIHLFFWLDLPLPGGFSS